MNSISDNNRHSSIDKVSASFCLAKWYHLTVNLDRASVQSCYHTPELYLQASDLDMGERVFNNSEFRIQERKMMLAGVRPASCSFCWRYEDSCSQNDRRNSDRYKKSTSDWAFSNIGGDIENLSLVADPAYLEVNIGSICNLKCIYCGPHNSSAWRAEIEKFGNYTGRTFPSPLSVEIVEKFKEMFWTWFRSSVSHLKILRITGGEPILNDDFERLVKLIAEQDNRSLVLILNSNLSISSDRFQARIQPLIDLKRNKLIKEFRVITSMEATGSIAETIRYGSSESEIFENINFLCSSKIFVSITSTIQALSIDTFEKFVRTVVRFREESKFDNLVFDPTPIVYPKYLRVEYLDDAQKETFCRQLGSLLSLRLKENEKVKLKVLVSTLNANFEQDDRAENQEQLRIFIEEMIKIRKLNSDQVPVGPWKYSKFKS